MPNYISFPVTVSPVALLQRAYAFLQSLMPSWQPAEGELDVWMLEATSTEVSELIDIASHVPDTIYRYFGSTLVGVIPIDATIAVGTTTWYMLDSAGHTINAGTQVAITNADGELIPFLTLNQVSVPVGSSSTAAGEVTIIALTPGARSNNVGVAGGPVQLQDIIPYIDHITLVAPTSQGQDAETDATYLGRLTGELRLLTRTPILPQDFSALARTISPTYRSVAIDLYNPADGTTNNPRMVTLYDIDSSGTGVDSATKTAIKNLLQSRREVNFIVNTDDPTYTAVAVTVQVKVLPGYNAMAVQTAVIAALNAYLSSAIWGNNGVDPQSWVNVTSIYKYEISQVINNSPGVDRIVGPLLIGPDGGTLLEADLALTGKVPLPRPGTLTVTTI